MRAYLQSAWVKVGLGLFLVGTGPLLFIILAAAIGVWPDPNPNPIGLPYYSFSPSGRPLSASLSESYVSACVTANARLSYAGLAARLHEVASHAPSKGDAEPIDPSVERPASDEKVGGTRGYHRHPMQQCVRA